MLNKVKYLRQQSSFSQSGFSLVELMVGLVIGLIATLIIVQTLSVFEGNKRSTTGTADAQTNGNIGLYIVQRELQFAGYGMPLVSGTMPENATPYGVTYLDNAALTDAQIEANYDARKAAYAARVAADKAKVDAGYVFSALKCSISPDSNFDADNDASTPDILKSKVIDPVTVTNGVGGASDTIAIRYGDTTRGALPTNIDATPAIAPSITVGNNLGCRPGDVVLIANSVNNATGNAACFITKTTSTLAELTNVPHNTLKLASLAGVNTAADPAQRVSCLGRVRETTFSVGNGANANQLLKNGVPVIGEIVSLQAQYGISSSPNSEIVALPDPDDPVDPFRINSWVNATGVWQNPPNTGAVCNAITANRNCIKAVRIAIVARNNLLESTAVSQACNGAAATARVCAFGQNIAFANADWQNYRYRVYEVVVPLRNILAATPQL